MGSSWERGPSPFPFTFARARKAGLFSAPIFPISRAERGKIAALGETCETSAAGVPAV